MRNERSGLAIVLLITAAAAQAEPGTWFAPSPCNPDNPVVVALLGGDAFLSVHYAPGTPPHDVQLHRGEDGRYRVRLEEWSVWTGKAPQTVETRAGVREVPLEAHEGFAYRIDGCTSELWVDANPDRLQQLHPGSQRELAAITPAGRGGFLNLDAEYGGLAGPDALFGLFDLGVFLPSGAGRSGFLADRQRLARLDSSWIVDDPLHAVRLRVGDSITHSPDWESAARFGGVQWGTDFSLQPDRVTFPLPSIAGSAGLASTAQLYMNGERVDQQQTLQPGRFLFDSVPVLTGAGELSVTVRDATGRVQTVVQPFYASTRLLERGLSAWTVEGGFLRESYAVSDDRYTRPMAAALLQQGLNDHLTGLLRVVSGEQRQQAGAEADWIVGTLGVLTASGAVSHTEAGWGGVGTLGFERVANPVSLFVRRRYATSAYGDLGRNPGSLHFSDAARLSCNMGRAGVASLVYISEQPWQGVGTRLAGLAYNFQIMPGMQSYASWLHPLAGGGDSLVLGLSLSFGHGTSGGVQWNRDSGAAGLRAYAQHSPAGPLGWSWYGSGDTRRGGVRQLQAAWATERGTVGGGWAEFDGRDSPSATLQTGLALLDGHPYWTRPVQNSFAVVDAGTVSSVRVYRENLLVGKTGADGRLLVPDLLPFQANHLGIDDRDLPISLGLSSGAAVVAPPASVGVPVHFAVDAQAAQRFRLVDARGAPVPAGAELTVDGTTLPLPVGYDGLVYANLKDGRHRLEARWPRGQCIARLSVGGTGVRVLQPCLRSMR